MGESGGTGMLASFYDTITSPSTQRLQVIDHNESLADIGVNYSGNELVLKSGGTISGKYTGVGSRGAFSFTIYKNGMLAFSTGTISAVSVPTAFTPFTVSAGDVINVCGADAYSLSETSFCSMRLE